jgi:ligand-binding sensor domain-containing protein
MRIANRSSCCLAFGCVLLLWCARALALDPALDIGQYAHTAWKIRDVFANGRITAIAQTSDCYLWFGTDFGLLRFDGVRSVPWQPPAGCRYRQTHSVLLGARDGTLWIGTFRGLAAWNGHELSSYPRFDGYAITGILQDREGTVWVTANESLKAGLVCAIRVAGPDCHGMDGSLGTWTAPYEASRGVLWAGEAAREARAVRVRVPDRFPAAAWAHISP